MFLVQVKSQFLLDKSRVCEKNIPSFTTVYNPYYYPYYIYPYCWLRLPSYSTMSPILAWFIPPEYRNVSHDIRGLYKVLPPSYVNWCFKATINPSDTSEVEQLG